MCNHIILPRGPSQLLIIAFWCTAQQKHGRFPLLADHTSGFIGVSKKTCGRFHFAVGSTQLRNHKLFGNSDNLIRGEQQASSDPQGEWSPFTCSRGAAGVQRPLRVPSSEPTGRHCLAEPQVRSVKVTELPLTF